MLSFGCLSDNASTCWGRVCYLSLLPPLVPSQDTRPCTRIHRSSPSSLPFHLHPPKVGTRPQNPGQPHQCHTSTPALLLRCRPITGREPSPSPTPSPFPSQFQAARPAKACSTLPRPPYPQTQVILACSPPCSYISAARSQVLTCPFSLLSLPLFLPICRSPVSPLIALPFSRWYRLQHSTYTMKLPIISIKIRA
jgi:hypothetical protein